MKTLNYIDMTYDEVKALDRAKTVFFSSISPVETHGPHLPLGTDIFISEHLRDRAIALFGERHSDFTAVVLPTLGIGSDAIPVEGSFRIRYKAIYYSLLDTGAALAKMGFRFWLLTDNHGGPHHQIAIELAARKLVRAGMTLIAPFHYEFRRMVEHSPELLNATGLKPDTCGGVEDAHGGTNETSIMLAACPDRVRPVWKKLGRGKESPRGAQFHLLEGIGRMLAAVGAKDAATDFHFIAHGLAWVSYSKMEPYQGTPSDATSEAGEAMLAWRAGTALGLLEKALEGKPERLKPLGWSIRSVRDVI